MLTGGAAYVAGHIAKHAPATIVSRVVVASPASMECSAPVIAITGIFRSTSIRANAHTSAVSPEADKASTRSHAVTAPESPCRASLEWMKVAG
jgi:hypothetical protein